MKRILLILFVFINNFLISQDIVYPQYPNPVKIPVYLSATFAELRSNAFHAGVDIKTQGVEGHEVFAVADGYVSRIGVSPFGYGKVLYITHNDGFTSVYAHLSKFNKVIGDFVKTKQYEEESFAQSIMLDKNQFPIKKGDFIGFTGNSGGSGGPHLHYEIRDTKTQEPVNPLFFGLKIKDTKKPAIKGLVLYPIEKSAINDNCVPQYIKVLCKDGKYYLEKSSFKASGDIAFGINVYDQADGANNKNGAYSVELFADNELIFSIVSDKYSYDETRYINSLIDYAYYVRNKERFIRTEVDALNKLKLYEKKNGVISIKEGDTVQMRYVIKDYNDNKSTLDFTLIGVQLPEMETQVLLSESYYSISNDDATTVNLNGFEAFVPKESFYTDVDIKAVQIDSIDDKCSEYVYQLGSDEIPLHKRITIRIKPEDMYCNDTNLYIASVNRKGELVYLGNAFEDDYIEAKTNVLGKYLIVRDDVKPMIKPLNFTDDSAVTANWSLRLEIDDKESGIKDYSMYVNGQWVLADYDAKNKLLMYQIDGHMKTGNNDLEVIVVDMVGNKSVYSTTLQR